MGKRDTVLEICCQDLASVHTALAAGAHRVELCTALDCGGLTPSYGLIAAAVSCAARSRRLESTSASLEPDAKSSLDAWRNPAIMVLVRPRAGGFVYTEDELRVMCADIRAARSAGAQGVVFGCLAAMGSDALSEVNKDRSSSALETKLAVDKEAMTQLLHVVREAKWGLGLQTQDAITHDGDSKPEAILGDGEVTFHRAFDDVGDPLRALDDIIALNTLTGELIKRILTSGSCATAEKGLDVLRQVCQRAQQAGDRIEIMPGAGITKDNVTRIIEETGCRQVHASAKTAFKCAKDDSRLFHVEEIAVTGEAEVRGIIAAMQTWEDRR